MTDAKFPVEALKMEWKSNEQLLDGWKHQLIPSVFKGGKSVYYCVVTLWIEATDMTLAHTTRKTSEVAEITFWRVWEEKHLNWIWKVIFKKSWKYLRLDHLSYICLLHFLIMTFLNKTFGHIILRWCTWNVSYFISILRLIWFLDFLHQKWTFILWNPVRTHISRRSHLLYCSLKPCPDSCRSIWTEEWYY